MSTIDSYDSYGVLHTNNNSGLPPNMRYAAEGAAVYRPMMPPTSPHSAAPPPTYQPGGDGSAATEADTMGIDGSGVQQTKRKRGRPRKYAVGDGSSMATPPPPSHLEAVFQSSGLSSPTTPAAASSSGKKSRGRPKGSKGRKLQRVASSMGSAGIGFTPHVITVKAGEDVSTKIMSFSQTGSSGICILSANGAISNVTLRQAATSGGTVTYEGRFEILSLSGSYMLLESGGQRSRTGGLSALLAGPDGRVLGGGVAGVLTAAAPVQVVVGCFTPGPEVFKSPNQVTDPSTAPTNPVPEASAAGSPVSHGTMSESSGEPGSPLNQSTGAYDNGSNQQGMNLSWQ